MSSILILVMVIVLVVVISGVVILSANSSTCCDTASTCAGDTERKPRALGDMLRVGPFMGSKKPHRYVTDNMAPDVVPEGEDPMPYITGVEKSYVINLVKRPERWEQMCAQFGPWSTYLTRWEATDGRTSGIMEDLEERGKLGRRRLKPGEYGCYDSHVRVWQDMVRNSVQVAFIFEDDANYGYSRDLREKTEHAVRDVNFYDPKWDLLYVGFHKHMNNERIGELHIAHVASRKNSQWHQGMWGYMVTLRGAQKLCRTIYPVSAPIDTHVAKLALMGYLRAYAAWPFMFSVTTDDSDTN